MKRAPGLAACLLVLLLGAACGGGSDGLAKPEPTPPPVASPPTTAMAFLQGHLGMSPSDQGWLQPFGASAAVTWTSSDPAVAGADAQGRVTALAVGSTAIRAQAGGQSAAAAVRVHAAGAAKAGALIASALARGRSAPSRP